MGSRGRLVLTLAFIAAVALPALVTRVPAAAAAVIAPPSLVALQQAELSDGQPVPYEDLGCAVALDGDTALVGADGSTTAGQPYAGSALVYVRTGAGWVPQAVLTAPVAAAGDGFGRAVALDGDTALIGAPDRSTDAGQFAGAAYVYVRAGGSWSLQAQLSPAAAAANDWFGASVALDGETALVGASGRAGGGQAYAGAAFVFTRSGTSWWQQAELRAADGVAGDGLGAAVALSGDTALVGAENRAVGGAAQAGAAYVFARSGSSWWQQAVLADPGAEAGDWFGAAVALSGDRALVGAWGTAVDGRLEAGAAYVFGRDAAGWTQVGRVTPAGTTAGATFGTAVAIAGDTTLAGAPREAVAGQASAGAAYVHTLAPAPSVSLAASPSTTRRGRPVTLTGMVTNVAGARTVSIRRRVAGAWVQLKQLNLSGAGGFSWAMPVPKAGTQLLMAAYQAGGLTFQSAPVTVVARKK